MAWYNKDGVKQGELTNFALFSPLLATLAPTIGMAYPSSGLTDCLPNPTSACARTQSDFRVIFDEYRKRFWVVAGAGVYKATNPAGTARGIFLVAVSKSEDPKDGWFLYWMDAVAHWGKVNDPIYTPGDGADYPCIGIDPHCFHLTNKVAPMGSEDAKYWHVAFFRADDSKAINGLPPTGWHYYDLQDPTGALVTSVIQPVVHHGVTGRAYYVSRYLDDSVLVWALTDPLTPAQQLERAEVKLVDKSGAGVPFHEPVDAPQKNSASKIKMTNLGTNILKAVYRAGLLCFVANDAQDWFSPGTFLTSVRLVRLFVLSFPNIPTLGDPSYINRRFGKNSSDDNPQDRLYYGWPAVEVNRNSDLAVVYARTGSTIFPEVRYSVYLGAESDIRSSRVLQHGFASYTGSDRWGDTAGAAVDPSDDTGIWIAQQYANASNRWDIWVGKIFGQ